MEERTSDGWIAKRDEACAILKKALSQYSPAGLVVAWTGGKDSTLLLHLALATAIRRDEHPARQAETAFSPREDPRHVRVHPLLSFRERDVWDATLGLGLPYCELYRAGYRSLGTRTGTVKNADIPAWEQDLEQTPERDIRGKRRPWPSSGPWDTCETGIPRPCRIRLLNGEFSFCLVPGQVCA